MQSKSTTALQEGWTVDDDLRAQHEYVKRNRNFDFPLKIEEAFVKGMRSVGYRSTAAALDELLDNAIQAGATKVQVVFDGDQTARRARKGKPPSASRSPECSYIAVIDDGHGMESDMVRLAMIWGGTHRENDRRGFGRFGFGLPTASISRGKSYSVLSRLDGDDFYGITFDTSNISQYADDKGIFVMPVATRMEPPEELRPIIESEFGGLRHGTIVLWQKLDNLEWTAQQLQRNLLHHIGVYYLRTLLTMLTVKVNGTQVEPVDPLFLTESAMYYNLDSDHAEPYPEIKVPVKGKDGEVQGVIDVRISYMNPAFSKVKGYKHLSRGKTNERYPILRHYNNGIIVCRNGRRIDTVAPRWKSATITRDYYWGVELNFPATLDEHFSISTIKQRVALTPGIWTLLEEYDVRRVLQEINDRGNKERRRREQEAGEDPSVSRPSELAVHDAIKLRGHKTTPLSTSRAHEAVQALEEDVLRIVREHRTTHSQALAEITEQIQRRPYQVQTENAHEGPFYRVSPRGSQKLLFINADHPFYTRLYAGPRSDNELRAGLEIILFAIADAELNADGELLKMYRNERQVWSRLIRDGLENLVELFPQFALDPSGSDSITQTDGESEDSEHTQSELSL